MMIEIQKYEQLLPIAGDQINTTFVGYDNDYNPIDFVDLVFKSQAMFKAFKEFCKAEGIKTRHVLNAKLGWDDKRREDDEPFAKRLRVQKSALEDWLKTNTDVKLGGNYHHDDLEHALSLLALATISDQNYTIYAKEELPYTKQIVTIYQVDDGQLAVELSHGDDNSYYGPRLVSAMGEWEVTKLDSLEYRPLKEIAEAINGLNSDLDLINKTREECKGAEPLISNRERQELPGVTKKQAA